MPHMCDRCIRSFHTRENFEEHYEFCIQGRAQMESLPKEKEFKSRSFEKEISPLKVVYADIACFEKWHSEVPYSSSSMKYWDGENCIPNFLNYLEKIAIQQHWYDIKLTRKRIAMSVEDEKNFNEAVSCIHLSLIHISEPTRPLYISYAVFCLKKKSGLL